MSNYPLGAKDDPNAPYNEQEEIFSFDVEVKGNIYVAHNGYIDKDEVLKQYREKLQNYIDNLEDGDIEITNSFVEVWQ